MTTSARARGGYLRFLGPLLVAIAPTLMGARCNPTPPACDGNDPVCAPDQLEVCLNQCVTPAIEGRLCSPHPCDGSGLPPCEPGLHCTEDPFQPGRHVCLPPTSPFDPLFCHTSDPGRHCPTGLYCRGLEDAENPAMRCPGLVRTQTMPPDFDGICTLPSREGRECDGNWNDLGACRACEPGTECRDDAPGWNGTAVCVRTCDAPGDCPCPSQLENVLDVCTPVPATGESVCTNCVSLGAACDATSSWGCCDDGAVCAGVCCLGDGATCSSTDDCCGTALCAGDGTCHACTTGGEPIDRKGPGCCYGTEDAAGICPLSCFVRRGTGVVRVVEGETCGSGACTGTYDCDRDGGTGTCRVMNPPPETFDCVDNDCDSRVDEDIPDSARVCHGPVLPSEEPSRDFAGCPDLDLQGRLVCRGGAPVCSVTTGWCAYDNLFNQLDHSGMDEECFSGAGNCSTFACHAGEWCCLIEAGSAECQPLGTISGVPIDGYPHPPECWLPGELNMDLECPAPDQCMRHGSDCEACAMDSECGFCESYGVCLPGDDTGPSMIVDCGPSGDPLDGWVRDAMMCGP